MNAKNQSIMERRKVKVRPISLKRITNNKANDNSALKLQASAGKGQPLPGVQSMVNKSAPGMFPANS